MHRVVLSVFKVVAVSMILMFLFSVVYNVIVIMSVNSKINSLAVIIKQVLEENDCIPNGIASTFNSDFKSIESSSNGMVSSISWNLNNSYTDSNGITYNQINQSSVSTYNVNYGTDLTLVIIVDLSPNWFFLNSNGGLSSTQSSNTLSSTQSSNTLTYVWSVPALRYLK